MKLFIASIKITGGMLKNNTLHSVPEKSIEFAISDLQEQVHNAAGTADWSNTADWTKVTITTYTATETKEISVV